MFKSILLQRKIASIIFIVLLQSFALKYSPKILAQLPYISNSSNINTIENSQLEKFAKAVKSLQMIDRMTQLEMLKAIKAIEMSPEEFMKIGQQEKNKRNLNMEKQIKFEETLITVKRINQKDRLEKREAIKNAGLEVSQFNRIGKMVEQNPELQKVVVKLLGI
ncbi:DUF4168 domain-containing protein [Candidatus Atelocyanobacterium thalassae]|uniref:DUF4168 domain-containing protein n=1 Tax=cyanobacterium endosymbiont of Braarudosphaera bigelowii TaxID=1285375 RepID=A0ABN6K3Q9_9CHRO|nr:DUF4168 domain-containing protein [Candidatus Atelocyanobacterium thalassa]BDA39875.1 hypothetical protein CPARK_000071500 [cyanobacterium endosymbiont of Braarudosphaera bigelowii]